MKVLIAQAEAAAIAADVVKAMAEHKVQGSGLDGYLFLMGLLIVFSASAWLVRWIMTHNQTCVREITADHKESCKAIADTFREETTAMRIEHNEDRRVFSEGLRALRGRHE